MRRTYILFSFLLMACLLLGGCGLLFGDAAGELRDDGGTKMPAAQGERIPYKLSIEVDGERRATADEKRAAATDPDGESEGVSLGGSPEDYGAYFSQMVQTTVEPVYPIANYGSAMAPFYSVLAIWVGGVMLVAILKPHARLEGLVDPKPHQLFFGRYFLFFVMSQIQAAVIVAGDLLVLKIQCVEPALLFATGAITSLVFSLLIYALTVSFGDVGKAVVVVVMVLQIAGSSGTFPIELLPDVYQKIYHIFPFPYAIDAVRECVCGLYGTTWLKNIGCLLIFGAAALVIGLLVRKPFMGLNHFMEEKLKETEML